MVWRLPDQWLSRRECPLKNSGTAHAPRCDCDAVKLAIGAFVTEQFNCGMGIRVPMTQMPVFAVSLTMIDSLVLQLA